MSEKTKTYIYVLVAFEGTSHLYSYKTTDTSIKPGDYVIVPVAGKDPQTVLVKKVGFYTEQNAPYPVNKTKDVIGHATGPNNSKSMSSVKQDRPLTSTRTFSNNDAQNQIDRFKELVANYEEAGRYKSKLITNANQFIKNDKYKNLYSKQIENYLERNEPVNEENEISKQLILCLYKLNMSLDAFKDTEKLQYEHQQKIRDAINDLTAATKNIKWFFASSNKKKLAISAYQLLSEGIDNAFIYNGERIPAQIRMIDSSNADTAWANFLNDRKQYRELIEKHLYNEPSRRETIQSIQLLYDKCRSFLKEYENIIHKTNQFTKEIKEAAELVRNEETIKKLTYIPVESLYRNPNSFISKALRDVGYSNIAEIMRAEPETLLGIYGINDTAVRSIKNGGNEIFQKTFLQTKIRINSDDKTQSTGALIVAVCKYSPYFSDIKQLEDEFQLLHGETMNSDLEKLKSLSGGFQWLLMEENSKISLKNSYDRIRGFVNSDFSERVAAVSKHINQPQQMQQIDAWKGFADNSSLYYTILEDTIPGLVEHKQNTMRNNSQDNKQRKLYCPYDGQELKYIRNEDGEKKHLETRSAPIYKCAYCNKEYTSFKTKPDLSKVVIDGKRYINLHTDKVSLSKRQTIKLSPYEGDSTSIKNSYVKPSCYIAADNVSDCKNCNCQLIGAQLSILNSYQHEMVKKVKYCPSCGTFYIPSSIVKHCKDVFEIKNLDKFKMLLDDQQKQSAENDVKKLQTIEFKDFVVRRNTFSCYNKEHQIEEIAAVIKVMDRRGNVFQRKISAGYCSACKIYFIMESTFQKLKSSGTILCQVCDEKTYLKNGGKRISNSSLSSESLLMQYGYNVREKENIPKEQRWKILEMIIDNRVLSKDQVISYLDFFINYHKQHVLAVSKWETDRDHIVNYKMDLKRKIGVKSIRR